ncbi:hypothetical protein [Streptomyces sp. NPDC048577]|uniref:hypothetical protein n=1 Tax=Streptomyces sp. NPDC048577 TaxID=3157209 RepID=UPI0034499EF5
MDDGRVAELVAQAQAGGLLPHHHGRTDGVGVGTRARRITRQTPGRADFDLLRHRTLLH